jgi:transposase-like protein
LVDELASLVTRRWTEKEARKVLRAHARSGKSVLAFAEEHGLVAERVYRWRRRLDGGAPEHDDHDREHDIEFAPVVVTNARESAVLVRVGELEVEVTDPSNVPPEWIASVLAEVRGR